eukprot:CAMPEP_0197653512 /NCGR_PEP_ID=MMETSP1338-20131121/35840_1 /TAXON_ID=43686 ORGANISM="Pelagodinium beii, Strain RCC1491" /NCGR_SAMPLE_ID=MMETSP1338 /ASSEMBLY_ACC=CAM_ASM_000754 /LENGTH=738 /DNA_ID=CAMNT_0043228649 /DNA_START=72 /DNA_END=2288 /DNA_ORIENTATION=+
MSLSKCNAGVVAGALGAAILGSTQAFVAAPAAAPKASTLRGSTSSAAPSAASAEVAALALGSAAIGAAAVSSRRAKPKNSTVVRLATATGETEVEPFAQGLIGSESAFSGGDFNFDPLGLAEKCPIWVPWFREAELKHGRIAMLAFVGLLAPEVFRFGEGDCFAAQNVVEAHNLCVGNPPFPFDGRIDDLSGEKYGFKSGPMLLGLWTCGFIEMMTIFPRLNNISQRPGLTVRNAGDYRLGINFLPKDETKAKEMRLKELKNGRLAMLAFGGAITQATLSGNGFPWLYATKESKLSMSASPATASSAFAGARKSTTSRVARKAEGGYKMSAAVPFLPASPTLAGLADEETGFDPMGFSLAWDIRWLREAELKHGRVCMLATTGWIATDLGLRVPGDAFQVSSIDAHNASVKFGGMPQILLWIGLLEVFGALAMIQMYTGKTDRTPGDFGLRTFYPADEKGQYDMQLKELRNGRLAMLAYSGIVTIAVFTGAKWPFIQNYPGLQAVADDHRQATGSAFCGARRPSPAPAATARRAMETSKSLPFLPKPKNLEGLAGGEAEFDPLCLAEIYDVRWLREAELKHCRVCMLAALGFLTQQYVTLPGFTPTPDANLAPQTAAGGLAALIAAAGFIESSVYNGKITMLDMFEGEGADRAPGDLNFGKGFLPKDEAAANDLKEKELANGRLAMIAIGGMINHNLVVKGPLFPLVPPGWTGYELQSAWNLNGTGSLISSWSTQLAQ